MAAIVPPARDCRANNRPSDADRSNIFGSDYKLINKHQPMSRLLNWALTDLMQQHQEVIMMGEDVGNKGGVYGVTQKLSDRFGPDRVIDTLLDEQSVLGLAIGLGHNGFIPMPEIQFLAYLHNAEDQLRGEAATLSFFSNGQFTNPMVLRIAGLGYQKGFGGHFHNDNSLAVLRDIPGIVIACPSRGDEAAMILRECVRLAREEQRVVVMIEPIALYHVRDLLEDKDNQWASVYPSPDRSIPLGEVGVDGTGPLAILTYGNGRYLSTQAAVDLKVQGIECRVIDLRWLAPLPIGGILSALDGAKKVLIVDECRGTGGQSEALMTLLSERTNLSHSRIAAKDSFIPTGPSYASTMPSRLSITEAAKQLWEQK
jgi:2-oxoisovalerate dehydrogenase E1 component